VGALKRHVGDIGKAHFGWFFGEQVMPKRAYVGKNNIQSSCEHEGMRHIKPI